MFSALLIYSAYLFIAFFFYFFFLTALLPINLFIYGIITSNVAPVYYKKFVVAYVIKVIESAFISSKTTLRTLTTLYLKIYEHVGNRKSS